MDKYDDPHRYDALIPLPCPEPKSRPRMSLRKRAAQFRGFMPMADYDKLLIEHTRQTQAYLELTEEEKALLDLKLQYLHRHRHLCPVLRVTYFKQDPTKAGGSYEEYQGVIARLDTHKRRLIFQDGVELRARDIYKLESDLFQELEL